MKVKFIGDTEGIVTTVTNTYADIHFSEDKNYFYVELEYRLPYFADGEEYVFMPSCCYDGNRFEVLKKEYPPLFTPEEAKVDLPITVTDIPRLKKDGSGVIEITSGDVSVPCIGIFSRKEKKAVFLFTIQQINGINMGLSYEKGSIRLTYPHMRKKEMYRFMHMIPSTDKGCFFEKGTKIEIPYRLYEFDCDSLKDFYHFFFENRKCMGMDDVLPDPIPCELRFEIQRKKLNDVNWREAGGFYGFDPGEGEWSPGWCGCGIYSFPLMKLGGKLEWERGMSTLEHIFRTQTPCGFLYDSADSSGKPLLERGIHGISYSAKWVMLRECADVLYYLFKHFYLLKERGVEIPKHWEEGTKKLADAFVRNWKKYGQVGQFAHCDTGDLIVGGSTAGGILPGGLIEAGVYFNDYEYIETAKEIGEYFCEKVLSEGYTTGGPGEILQCPDSESAFGLLESVVVLYEKTGEERWIEYAKFLIEFCSSWVVAYNYCYPNNSEFFRLDMKSIGCIFASVQNKHAAPGICTFSGNSIYKLCQWTGNEKYLELFHEIVHTVPQYMSREDRPIHPWKNKQDEETLALAAGVINERVNMSDWEGENCVGGVFNGHCCWCETSSLLIMAECNM